jgi:hypothetical protein
MALLTLGVTMCGICGQTIDDARDAVLFAAFVVNAADATYPFNDGAFHRCCVEGDEVGTRCLELWEEFRVSNGPAGKPCSVCDRTIIDYREHIGFGALSSDVDSPLHRLNFVQLHRSHVVDWDDLGDTLSVLRSSLRDGQLVGVEAERLLEELESLGW